MLFSEKILNFLFSLHIDPKILPDKIQVMYPWQDPKVKQIMSLFYNKYYNDSEKRFLILGINPGRLGAGSTGIPFTDTKRLESDCYIPVTHSKTHEPSSVFIYETIRAFGDAAYFYNKFYISSVSPVGFIVEKDKGKFINYNYYDSAKLTNALREFIIDQLKEQLKFGIYTEVCFCLGTGKNYKYLNKLNDDIRVFDKIVPLEHPRYVMQYKNKSKPSYIDKYLSSFHEAIETIK